MRRSAGFSAFDVTITLAIIAIMATFVTPPFLRWLQGHRLRGSATNLVADIETAKIRAVRENAFVAFDFNSNGYTVFIDNGAGPGVGGVAGDWIRNGTETLILDRRLPGNVRVDGFAALDNQVRFNSRGVPQDLAGTLVIPLINDSGRSEVSLNRIGNATSN